MSDSVWAMILFLWTFVVEILSIWYYSREEKTLNDKIKELKLELWDKEKEISFLKGKIDGRKREENAGED